ncbi:MAG: hypothetical protein GEV11_03880 [Streptosporangiales bacterium]|nr:hypothetical protein [Streptosporangiales bacterium]
MPLRVRARTGRDVWGGAATTAEPAALPAAILRAGAAASRTGGTGGRPYRNADERAGTALLRGAFGGAAGARFAEAVLEPLRVYDVRRRAGTPTLVQCLRTFLDEGQNLEGAARTLQIHRNTLRARLRAAERATGRDLTDPGRPSGTLARHHPEPRPRRPPAPCGPRRKTMR